MKRTGAYGGGLTWNEQAEEENTFIAVVLFLDKKYKPKKCPLYCAPPNRMIRITLEQCLKSLGNKASALTVLKPFGISDKNKLPEAAAQWKKEIDSLNIPEHKAKKLIELLEYVMLQRFPKLSLKEIQTMIQLTPLEETVAGQELIQMGIEKGTAKGFEDGFEDGIEKGELIGKIHMVQHFMKYPLTPKKSLLQKSMKDLKTILKQLEAKLSNA